MIGTTISHYKVLEKIGEGGMGVVYKARDLKLDRFVALKFLPPHLGKEDEEKERFIHEAKAASALEHNNICNIHEIDKTEDGRLFIVMAHYEGKILTDRIQKGPLKIDEAVNITIQVAQGLEKAHRKGIVHRDIKPGNLLVTEDGVVKILDFGLAKLSGYTKLTKEGSTLGTVSYMSPEQARGGDVDQSTDIWSLGVVLYEMITGELPFKGEFEQAIIYSILNEQPAPISSIRDDIPQNVEKVVSKAISKDSSQRYQKVSELLSELDEIKKGILTAESIKPEKRPITSREITVKFDVKKGLLPILTLIAFVVVLTLVWFFLRQHKVSPPKEEPNPISILIADFENQTGDPVFDGAIEHALSLGLNGVSFIANYGRVNARKVAVQLDPNAGGRLDNQMAQAVCRREGVDLVIAGSIEPNGKGYMINAWALHPTESEKITEVSEDINKKANVLKATDKLAARLASKLGGVEVRYRGHITTTSLEAMNAFSKAFNFEQEGKDEEAVQEYLRAIREDPGFGRAYSNLAIVYYNLGQEQKSIEYHEMAMTHMDRMAEQEKNTIRAKYYLIGRNYRKAIDVLNAVLELDPQNHWAHSNLAFAYFFARDMKRAVELGKRDLERSPESITARYNMVWYAMGAGDFEMAEKEIRTLLNLKPEFEDGYVCLALIDLIQGRTTQAIETYEKLQSLSSYGSSYAIMGLADLAMYEGRLVDAKQLLEEGIAVDFENGLNDFAAEKLIMLAQTFLIQGKKVLAVDAADSAASASNKISVMFSAAKIFISSDREDKARALTKKLDEKIYPEYQSYTKLLQGEIKLSKDDVHGALRLFQDARSLLDTWLIQYALGRAYIEAGAYTEAHESFELCLRRRGEATSVFFDDLPSCRYMPSVYYYLGRSQEGLKSPAATESYQNFLNIKVRGDIDPMVEDARKRLERLEGMD